MPLSNATDLPNCRTCRFFYVTWDANYPYGCDSFSMKCKNFPAYEVFKRSGVRCLYFEKKMLRTTGNKKGAYGKNTTENRSSTVDEGKALDNTTPNGEGVNNKKGSDGVDLFV